MKYKSYTVFEISMGEEIVKFMTLTDVKHIIKKSNNSCPHCKCPCVNCTKCRERNNNGN